MTATRVLRNYLICLSVWSAGTLFGYISIILGEAFCTHLIMMYIAWSTVFSLTFEAAYKRHAFFLVTRAERRQLALLRLAVAYAHILVFTLLDLLLLLNGVYVFLLAYTALGLNLFCVSIVIAARAAGDENKAFAFLRIVAALVVIFSFVLPYLYTLPKWNTEKLSLYVAVGCLFVGVLSAIASSVAFYRRRNLLSYA